MPNKYYSLAKKKLFLLNRSITGDAEKSCLNCKSNGQGYKEAITIFYL